MLCAKNTFGQVRSRAFEHYKCLVIPAHHAWWSQHTMALRSSSILYLAWRVKLAIFHEWLKSITDYSAREKLSSGDTNPVVPASMSSKGGRGLSAREPAVCWSHCCGRKLSKVLSLSDCSVWTQDGEADVTVAALEPPGHLTTEYTFGRDSREWCTAIVLSFTCTSCKCSSWDDTYPLLKCESFQ